jgi:hypothetical protein
MNTSQRWPIASAVLAVILVGCATAVGSPEASARAPLRSDSEAPAVPGDADGTMEIIGGSAGGPGITIDEAIAQGGGEALLVNGALLIDPAGTVRLCSLMAESFPPQCGGTRLQVMGLDIGSLPNLQEANGVRWADQIQLFGTVTQAQR